MLLAALFELFKETPKTSPVVVNVIEMGPVVQSIVSLTSSLRGQLVKCFTTL